MIRALPSDKGLEVLRNRAKKALAAAGEEHTHLGYDGLVKLKVDGLLDQESIQMAVEDHREFLAGAAMDPRAGAASVRSTAGTRGDGGSVRCRSMDLDRRKDRGPHAVSSARSAACSGRSVSASPRGGSPIGRRSVPTRSSSGRSGGRVSRSRCGPRWSRLRPPRPRFPCSSSV
jgi:hypothetical protein